MRYIRPTSLSWWAGVFLIVLGALEAAGLPSQWAAGSEGREGALEALMAVLTSLTGADGASPAALISLGLATIGIRDAIKRQEFDPGEVRMIDILGDEDFHFDDDDDDDFDRRQPDGESPLPPGVIDPFAPGGSRG
jgi:hypothetical protein